MKMKNQYRLIALMLCVFGLNEQNLNAQDGERLLLTDTVTGHFVERLRRYPQEKLYLQTDKPYYISGEKIWFRAHKVDALLHTQTHTSRYVYVELIDPLDSVARRVKIHPDSLATFHGYMPLDEGLPEGHYTLRAYTRYMENQGEDYFFKKTVSVFDPLSLRFDTQTSFSFDGENLKASFRFVDRQSGRSFEPESATARLNRKAEKKLSFDGDTTTSVTFRGLEKEQSNVIALNFSHDGKKYAKYIRTPLPDADFDVSFMPEGGRLLAGTNNTVAFKSIKSDGLSENIACTVIDHEGKILAKAPSLHLGMGAFDLYPEAGKKYTVECTNGKNIAKRFELPYAETRHCTLKVKVQTDQKGRFELKSIDYPDSTRFLIQATTKKGGKRVFLEVDKPRPFPEAKGVISSRELFPENLPGNYIAKADEKYLSENGMRIVNLAEVEVTAKRKAPTQSAYYSAVTSSQVITAADIDKSHYTNMKMLLMQIPGITIIGDKVSVRNSGAPLVVIDDAPDENFDILSMEVSDISDIFLIKDASAGAMFGPRAINGALVISTKEGFVQKRAKNHNINDFIELLGFQSPLEFYSPKYDVKQKYAPADLRSTIYWNPNVRVSETGEVSLDFYSADAETTYSVVIEGVSDQGHLIYKRAKIQRINNCGLYILNARVSENRICVGQCKVEEKSNEITAIPKALSSPDIEEAVVSIRLKAINRDFLKTRNVHLELIRDYNVASGNTLLYQR
jgi:hypothetical protein